ncbi:MAG: PAS domain S-box protein, partial [Myxococcales bacterium]|nr:PAS domain S-box protein [Myxococcales bacterium]
MHAPSDEALRDLAALLPDALFVVRERSIVYANERGASMLGAPAASLAARNLADFLDEGDLRRVVAQEEALREGWDTPQTCRLRFRTEAGVVVIADVRYVLLWGNRLGMIARDVSEQLRAEGLMERLARATTEAPPNGDAIAILSACEPIFLELGWGVAFTDVLERTSITRKVIAAPGDPVGAYGRTLLGREVPFSETPILARVAETGRPVYMPNLPTWEHQPLSDAHALSLSMRKARVGRSVWCPIVEGGRVTQLLVVVARDLTEHDSIALQLFAAQLGAA